MKVLICSINSKYIHSSLAPWCLAGGIEAYADNVEYDVLECTINEKIEDVYSKLQAEKYEIIGFCTYIWNVGYIKKLCQMIKSNHNTKIVVGGPEVSYNASEVLKNPDIDFVLCGEGELTFAKLVRGDSLEGIEGLCYRKENEIVVKEPYTPFNEPPSPYVEKYFEKLNGRIAYIETSRGCPFRCAFCLSGRCGGVRFFDIEEAKKRIVLLANSGTKTIKFIDRTFNASKKRTLELWKFIIENYGKALPKGICFHFEIEGELIDDEILELLKKAPKGAIQFEIGIQSFNENTLKYINRNTNFKKLAKNIKSIVALGNIHVHIDLIAGLPYESLEDFEKSFNEAYSLNTHMLQLGFLKLLHGSEMRENKKKFQCVYSKTPPYEVISTPWISKKELEIIHTCEDFFDKMYNSSRFKRTCKYLTSAIGNPFKTYTDFAIYASKKEKKNTLDDLTYEIFEYFSKNEKINKNLLRDNLVRDRLATNRMGMIPEFLKIHSPLLKKLLNDLEEKEETRKPKNTKRAISLLSSMDKYVYVDYTDIDPVTKEYELYEKNI